MIFYCNVRARNRDARLLRKIRKLKQWHKVFSVLPRRVSNKKCIWLEEVMRIGIYNEFFGRFDYIYKELER